MRLCRPWCWYLKDMHIDFNDIVLIVDGGGAVTNSVTNENLCLQLGPCRSKQTCALDCSQKAGLPGYCEGNICCCNIG